MLPGDLENEKKKAGIPASPHCGRHAAETAMVLGWRKHAIIDYSRLPRCFRTFALQSRTEGLEMFCPKCGDTLVEKNGVLTCVRGNMPLSPKLNRDFHDCFATNTRQPRESHWKNRIGGAWYCPGCGVRTTEEEPGVVRCPSCKRNLGEFLLHLIELHPHRRLENSSITTQK